MNKRLLNILCIVPLLALYSCNGSLSSGDLQAYVDDVDHGVKQVQREGDVVVEMTYKPSDFLVAQELAQKPHLSAAEVQALQDRYRQGMYFTLSMSRKGQELEVSAMNGQEDFARRVNQLSFGMKELITLHTSTQEVVPLLESIYPRMFGMTGKSTLLLVFDRAKAMRGEHFTITLNGYTLGVGAHAFRFNTNDIQNVPQLALEYDGEK